LEGVPLEPVTLVVHAEGYEEWDLDIEEGDTGDREEIAIILETARGAEGQVVDASGEPVARALVYCTDAEDDPSLGNNTDAEGRFVLPSRAVGCEAVARHPDHGDSDPTVLEPGSDNLLRLREPASISGYVVDERGSPLSGVTVAIESFVAASGRSVAGKRGRKVRGDDRGEFELGKLQAGTYILTATANGRPPARSDEIELANGERVRGIRIELGAGATLVGRVLDADSGEPIEGARVWLDALTLTSRPPPSTTDADGQYRLEGVPEGPFSVAAAAEGYVRRVVAGVETRGADRIERDVELTAHDGKGTVTEYSGIGATLARPPQGLMIGQVVPDGPSDEAGLQQRDLILRIDGEDTSAMTVSEAVQLLRGPSGTRVSLTIDREGAGQMDVVITRGTFTR
jgi:protocatechuate 3,4-dioxygenase beta subunit